jgi:type I site-specific restriction-modification system R (restriction) subunit
MKIEKGVETQSNSENINQTKLSYRIDTGLKTITTSIQKFGEVVVESIPCDVPAPVLSLPILNDSTPSLLIKLIVLVP